MHPRIKLDRLTTPICDRAATGEHEEALSWITPDIIPVQFFYPAAWQIRAQVEPDESTLQWISTPRQPVTMMGAAATKEAIR